MPLEVPLGNDWGIGQNLAKAGTGSGPAGVWFSDASWRTVNLPHDWAVELPFDKTADTAHGFKALGHGFPSNSAAWYGRAFELPKEDSGKRLWLEFDGVFRDCEIFVNAGSSAATKAVTAASATTSPTSRIAAARMWSR